jgi:high-affinity iron transporter
VVRFLLPALVCALLLAGGCGGDAHTAQSPASSYDAALQSADSAPQVIAHDRVLKPSALAAPIAHFRSYGAGVVDQFSADVTRLRSALASGGRTQSEAAWRVAFAGYLGLGAVYGEFGALDQAIDGLPFGLPGGVHDPQFTGLHRIEYGLWGDDEAPASLVGQADGLAANARKLHAAVATSPIPTLDYATRSHEIMEGVQRDFLSGVDVPWSHEGVLATQAGLVATREVAGTVASVLGGGVNDQLTVVFGRLGTALENVKAAHGGQLPPLQDLSRSELGQINAAVTGSLAVLQSLPTALETKQATVSPRIPTS